MFMAIVAIAAVVITYWPVVFGVLGLSIVLVLAYSHTAKRRQRERDIAEAWLRRVKER